MRAAAAQIWAHVLADLFVGRRAIAIEQRLRPHDHAGDAKAALRRLLIDERALEGGWIVECAEALQRRDASPFGYLHGGDARKDRPVVQQDRAGTALAQPASKLGSVEAEIIAQDIEQRRRRIDVDPMLATIDVEG